MSEQTTEQKAYHCTDDGWPMVPMRRYEWGTRYECPACGMTRPESVCERIEAERQTAAEWAQEELRSLVHGGP